MLVRDGKLLFLDSAPPHIIVYSLSGTVEGRGVACSCYFPRGMAPSNDGNLWVTDTGFGHIFKVSLDGATLASIGEKGSAPREFIEPSSVWESPQGYLYVADAGNRRVQSFSPELAPIAQWGMGEGTARDGNRVTGTPEGNVLLTQYDGRAVIEYGPEGDELGRWVYEQGGRTLIPSGIGPAGDGNYIVLYPFDNTAAIFALGR
jgi:sugar lactone lactonase YvrE